MPQVSQIDLKQGNIVDPTFGLQALARESERKTKENRQMEAVANTLRKQLELKKLSKGTTVTVNQGGGIEWTGENAAKDEANFNNWGKNDYGRKGKGNSVTSREISDGSVAARERGLAFVNSNKPEVDAVARRAAELAVGGVGTASAPLPPMPTQTTTGTTTPTTTTGTVSPALHPLISTPTPTNPVPLAPIPSTIAAPPPAVNVPYSGTTAVAQKVAQAATQNTNSHSSVRSGENKSYAASADGGTYAEQGTNMNLETTVNDTNVTDYLKLDQTDLAVAQAMQDIYAQINGGNSPKSYSNLMKMNEDTIAASRAAELASGTSTKEVPGRNWSVNMNGGRANVQESAGKDQSASTGGSTKVDHDEDYIVYTGTGESTSVKAKSNYVNYDKAGNRTAIIWDPETLAKAGNMKEWVDGQQAYYKSRNMELKEDTKTGNYYLYDLEDNEKVGRVLKTKSKISVNGNGEMVAPWADKGADNKVQQRDVMSIEFEPGKHSFNRFERATRQVVEKRINKGTPK